MSPELIDGAKWLGGIAVALFSWILQRNINRVEADIQSKADKEHMSREIERLEMALKENREALKENRDARERDKLDNERSSAERFNQFTESIRDRFSSFERNVDSQISNMGDNMESQLKLILHAIDGLRKDN